MIIDKILMLDFGSQYTQLIARRIRECKVYSEIYPYNVSLKKIKEFLERDANILFALVFGSAVEGRLTKESDIDVAIYVKEPFSAYDFLTLIDKLSKLAEREVHLVILNEASSLLRHQVMKNRKEFFIKDFLTYFKFREKTIDDYQEYLDITGYLKYVES